jgi:hypothetical protein
MEWAALISWIVTAGGGFILLTLWLRHGGMRQRGRRGRVRDGHVWRIRRLPGVRPHQPRRPPLYAFLFYIAARDTRGLGAAIWRLVRWLS